MEQKPGDDLKIFKNDEDKEFCKKLSELFYQYKINELKMEHTFCVPNNTHASIMWFVNIILQGQYP